MTENIPNNKSLSIRVCTNGLSFCSYTPLAETPFEYKVYDIQPTISLAANLRNALLNEPMLKEEYQRVNVLITTPHFTTVPVAFFKLDDAQKYYEAAFPKDKPLHISYNVLRRSGISIVFGLDKNVYQLIHDDFPRARFYASASTLIEFFGEKSMIGTNKKMYCYLHEKEMTLYAFDNGKMMFVNTFQVKAITDIQYYILNIWQQLGFDQTEDALYIIGDTLAKRKELVDKIQNFIGDVSLIDRKEDFKNEITEGDANIPYDLQTLLVCGF